MGKIESGYSIGRNDNGVVIKIFGEVPLRKVLNDLGKAATDSELKQEIQLKELKNAILDASTRLGAIISSGGMISSDGQFAFALPNQAQNFPHFPGKLIHFHPDFAQHLKVLWRSKRTKPEPFFYLEGRNGAQILVDSQIDAMINLVDQTYLRFKNPYPRFSSRSVVNQLLLSSIAVRDAKRAKK